MKAREVVFACLNCGADTGCANKLVCDKCRAGGRRKQASRSLRPRAKRRAPAGASATPTGHGI